MQTLGARPTAYGVRAEAYQTVGAALLWTLGQGLGAGFTPEVKQAWTAGSTPRAAAMPSGVPAVLANAA